MVGNPIIFGQLDVSTGVFLAFEGEGVGKLHVVAGLKFCGDEGGRLP